MSQTTEVSSHGVEDALVSNEEALAQIRMTSISVPFITEAFMKFIDSTLDAAFEGLNGFTIADPQRQEVLKTVYSLLPAGDDIARVADIRIALRRLISISNDTQQDRKTWHHSPRDRRKLWLQRIKSMSRSLKL